MTCSFFIDFLTMILSILWRNPCFTLGAKHCVVHVNFFCRAKTVLVECAWSRALDEHLCALSIELLSRLYVCKGLRKCATVTFYTAQTLGVVPNGDYACKTSAFYVVLTI